MSDRNGESSKRALIDNSASSSSITNGKGNDKGDTNGNGEISPAIDFTAGIIAGATGLIVGQPFDVVKVRYQTPQYIGRYGSTFSALGAIVKEEKFGGLFKGVTSPMAGIAFLQLPEGSAEEPTLGQIFLAGTGSGVVASILTCPTELIKIRQQSAPPHLNLTTFGVFKSIIRADGLKGIFRGFSATALRDVAYGPYFCTYEATLRFLKWMKRPPLPPSHHNPGHERHTLIDEAELERHSGLRWPELMLAGGIAGVLAWIVTFPIDVFKTRMQSTVWPDSTSNSTAKPKLQSFRQVAADALRKEGWRVMFAGLGPTLIRVHRGPVMIRIMIKRFTRNGRFDLNGGFC
ncbi:hypothetical protein D1P53_002768 [Cryptococcus gattii VGV]|nr:hypothetical protein D1P53_002768 [Cryptococcus gattii VGV]